jgi:hypothetical protein
MGVCIEVYNKFLNIKKGHWLAIRLKYKYIGLIYLLIQKNYFIFVHVLIMIHDVCIISQKSLRSFVVIINKINKYRMKSQKPQTY